MRPALRFVLFDLDGTLVDSSPLHDRAFREVIADRRPEWLASFRYDDIRGLTTADAFRTLGASDPELVELVSRKRAAYARLAQERGVRAFEGAAILLVALARRGIASYVVTSAARSSAQRSLGRTGLAPHVRGIVAAEDVSHGKPSPEPYLVALRRFGLRARDGLVVEDAASGLASARAAGLFAIRVHGYFDPRERGEWSSNLVTLRARLVRT